MKDRKYRTGWRHAQLMDLAEELGYTPGEFSLIRFAEDAKRIKEWNECIDKGLNPPDLINMSVVEAERIVRAETRALMKRERDWLSFFYPQMKQEAVSGTVAHEHKHDHKHSAEPLSETAQWVNEMLGGEEGSEAPESSTH